MKFSPVVFCLTTPALRPVAKNVSFSHLYNLCRLNAAMTMRFSPHGARFLSPVRTILSDHMSHERMAEVCREYLVHRQYLNYLGMVWRHLGESQQPGATIEDEGYLRAALSKGRGAVLVSGHNYGFSRMVVPLLARSDYRILRAGSLKIDDVQGKWGFAAPPEYVYLPEDPWERMRALKQVATALKNNQIIHFLVLNRPHGQSKAVVEFYGRDFSLDAATLEFISALQVPVLPCFALTRRDGALILKLHQPLDDTADMTTGFAKLFSWYLKEFPEYVRFWKPLLNQKPFW